MSEMLRLVAAGLVGGCCTMLVSAIAIVALAVRSKPSRPSDPRLHLVAADDATPEKIDYEELWRDPNVRVLGDVPPRHDGMR